MGYYGAHQRNRQPATGPPRYPVMDYDVGDYAGGIPAADVDGGGPLMGLRAGTGETDRDFALPDISAGQLATEGYQHVSIETPVALAPQDAPQGYIDQSTFNTRPAQHRLSYTMRSYGHWEQENLYGKHVSPPDRKHFSKLHIAKNSPPFAVPVGNRRNNRRPSPQSYGDIVGTAPHGRNQGNTAVTRADRRR